MYSSLRRGVEEGGGGRRKEERLFPREAPQRGGIRLLSLCRMRAAGGVAIADERPVCPPSLPPRLLPYLSISLSLALSLEADALRSHHWAQPPRPPSSVLCPTDGHA